MSGWRDRASMQRTASQFPRTDDETIWSDLEACDAKALMAAENRFAKAEREAAPSWEAVHGPDDGIGDEVEDPWITDLEPYDDDEREMEA